MASTVTLLQMRTAARQRADMVGSAFCTDPEIDGYLNAELQILYDMLLAAAGEAYYESSSPITTTTGVSTYSLPADFLRLLGLYRYQSTIGSKIDAELRRFMPLQESREVWGGDPSLPAYRLQGQKVFFVPEPRNGLNLLVRYVPAFTKLVLDGDLFDGINGFEDFAIWGAVSTMLTKEGSSTKEAMAQRDRQEVRIETMKSNRDEFRSVQVVDVSRRFLSGDYEDELLPRPT